MARVQNNQDGVAQGRAGGERGENLVQGEVGVAEGAHDGGVRFFGRVVGAVGPDAVLQEERPRAGGADSPGGSQIGGRGQNGEPMTPGGRTIRLAGAGAWATNSTPRSRGRAGAHQSRECWIRFKGNLRRKGFA